MTQTETPNINVMLVEDNDLFQQNITQLINAQPGMRCELVYATCEDAVSALDSIKPPQVILHDIGFEGMSGITSVGIIKRHFPETQIVMFTIFEDSDNIFDALCAGATGYLLKSSSEPVIIQAIHDVLAGGSPMNPTIARKAIDVFTKMHSVSKDYGLSGREREILEEIVEGYGNREIAEKLLISHHTIDAHLRKIYEKLHVHTRTEAATKALKERLV